MARVRYHLDQREAGSLAALMPAGAKAAPADQVGQWLFAFDAAGIAIFRALAMLALQIPLQDSGRAEAEGPTAPEVPFLRACILETIRLWPTTPAILRQTDRETEWALGTMPRNTGVLIHVPFLHRDDSRLPFAHRFAPDIWLTGEAGDWPLIPFSAGSGECPAKNLVLLLASMVLAELLRWRRYTMPQRKLDFHVSKLAATFDQFSLQLQTTRR